MFGLSTREVLSRAIVNAIINNKSYYKQLIKDNMEELESSPELIEAIRRDFFNEVSSSVISTFKTSSFPVYNKIRAMLNSPQECGYDIDIENGISAGSLYAICYYAMKNKIASSNDCVKLNHFQNEVMEICLAELDNEL